MTSEGPIGRGISCEGTSSSLSAPEVEAVGAQQAVFWMEPKGEGACWPSTKGEEALGEGAYLLALWNPGDTRSISQP